MTSRMNPWTSAAALACLAALLTSAVLRADDGAPTTSPSGDLFDGKPAGGDQVPPPPVDGGSTTRPTPSGPLNFAPLVRFQHILAGLGLSDPQKDQATTVLEDANQKVNDAMQDAHGRRAMRQIYYIVGNCRTQLLKLLTPDQADQFNQALPPPPSGGGYGRHGSGGPPSGGDDAPDQGN
jgi:hypothetical protein